MMAYKFPKILNFLLGISATFFLNLQSGAAESNSPHYPYPKKAFTISYDRVLYGKAYPHCKAISNGKGVITCAIREGSPVAENYATNTVDVKGYTYPVERFLGGELGFQIFEPLYLYNHGKSGPNGNMKPQALGEKSILAHHCRGWVIKSTDLSTGIKTDESSWFDVDSGLLVQNIRETFSPLWAKLFMWFDGKSEIRMTGFSPTAMTAAEIAGYQQKKGDWSWYYAQPPSN